MSTPSGYRLSAATGIHRGGWRYTLAPNDTSDLSVTGWQILALRGEIVRIIGGVDTEIRRFIAVDDCGTRINPMIVEGQVHGGIAQGVGQAMWEQCYIEPSSGQPMCGSFMDYGMPRSNTLPSFKAEIVEVLSPTNPLGIKGCGEAGAHLCFTRFRAFT